MIITNSTSRPSERFLEIIYPYFSQQGYEFKKSKKLFVRTFDKGTHHVGFWFRISTLTDVTLHWGLRLEKLENVFSQILERNKRDKSTLTLGTDLPNHTRWDNPIEMPVPLYDQKTLNYDDFSINKATQKIVESYNKYVIPYFEKYSNYQNVEEHFNSFQFKGIKGLVLAKYLSKTNFEEIAFTYFSQIKQRPGGENSEEMSLFNKTIEFLSKNDIAKLID
jgi:hypothetical protein